MPFTDEQRARGQQQAIIARRKMQTERREKVKVLRQDGKSIAKIARDLDVDPATISRDLQALNSVE